MDNLTKLDIIYKLIGTEINVLSKESEEYSVIEAMAGRKLTDVFKIGRWSEVCHNKTFAQFRGRNGSNGQPSVQMLFHGSPTMNFVGILSQGLKIGKLNLRHFQNELI